MTMLGYKVQYYGKVLDVIDTEIYEDWSGRDMLRVVVLENNMIRVLTGDINTFKFFK